MTNPAQELLEIFGKWTTEDGNSALATRRDASESQETQLGFWEDHARAVRCLIEIEQALDRLESVSGQNVQAWRRTLPGWYRSVFLADESGWVTPQAESIPLQPHEHDILQTLATHLGAAFRLYAVPPPEARDLQSALDVAEEVPEDDEIPVWLRAHLITRLNEAKDLVQAPTIFEVDRLRGLVAEIIGLLDTVDSAPVREDTHGWIRSTVDTIRDAFWRLLVSKGGDWAPTPGDQATPAALPPGPGG